MDRRPEVYAAGDDSWKVERGVAALPTYIWDSLRPYRHVRLLRSSIVDGLRTTALAFAGGNEDLPVWFELWVDDGGLVHRAEMRAPGHFMDHRYYDFNVPVTIRPPKGARK